VDSVRSGAAVQAARLTAAVERFQRPVRKEGGLWTRPDGVKPLFFQYRDVAAAVGVWILANVLFLSFWPEPYARERRYLETLQSVVTEADQLRAGSASGKEWQELAKWSRGKLAPIVADLRKSASASELARQQLLWSARDLAPKVMGPPTQERERHERHLSKYLQSVEQTIGRR
jgi:hypothetical protein